MFGDQFHLHPLLLWCGRVHAPHNRNTRHFYCPRSGKQECISSPFGPRVLPNQPKAGSHH